MLTINGDLLLTFKEFAGSAVVALLPLWGVIVGVFIAFAIANMVRHLILKMK